MASSSPPPLSSSPQNPFSSSSPFSDGSTRSGWSNGSGGSSITTASTSLGIPATSFVEDLFARRLRHLLLVVVRKREKESNVLEDGVRTAEGDDDDAYTDPSSSEGDTDSSVGTQATPCHSTKDFSPYFRTVPHAPNPVYNTFSPLTSAAPDSETEVEAEMSIDTCTDTDMETRLSTLIFASSTSVNTPSPVEKSDLHVIPPRPGYSYRLIKRASSYRRTRAAKLMDTDNAENADSEPPRKRPKILTRTSTHPRIRTELARVPASIRRAESLRSLCDGGDGYDEAWGKAKDRGKGKDRENIPPSELAPTVPASPELEHATPDTNILMQKKRALARCFQPLRRPFGPVPIIAPPLCIPAASAEPPSHTRVQRFLERERELRVEMGFRDGNLQESWSWGGKEGEEVLKRRVVRWFMEVLPSGSAGKVNVDCSRGCGSLGSCRPSFEAETKHDDDEEEDEGESEASPAKSNHSYLTSTSPKSTSNPCRRNPRSRTISISTRSNSGSGSDLGSDTTSNASTMTTTHTSRSPSPSSRIDLYPSYSFSLSSSSSSSFSYVSEPRPDMQVPYSSNLHEQLATSPHTRFHAAYIFWRFFRAVATPVSSPEFSPGVGSGAQDKRNERNGSSWVFGAELDREGRELVTWDIGVACLALCVKYHRDFLYPLYPVYASEFQAIAPHGTVEYEDLETAHRDVLCALAYRLGDTPHALLSELWEALPALRRVLQDGSESRLSENVNADWNAVQRETWRVLLGAALDPDILRFPLSLLTSTALLFGLCVVLQRRERDQTPWYHYKMCAPVLIATAGRGKAECAVSDVRSEVIRLLGVSEEAVDCCRVWLQRVLVRLPNGVDLNCAA
ncbi:hypothetical protein DXG03_009351 [Asterophora parasitica]|uniref:Uncharacterized protein n=1 Tax=Asterophora parasitica TaxID=117018 RepID=A0A9P7G6R6_9AGAR|nr:hypothetical protein DXG03_009351 [Asterophora parasitica]